MAKRTKKRKRRTGTRKPGAAPGTLSAVPGAEPSTLRVIMYDNTRLVEVEGLGALDRIDPEQVSWVDVVGLGSVDVVAAVGEKFGLHPLALEDVLHPHQRAKVDDYDHVLFFVSRVAREQDQELDLEQISMFIGPGFVVTFQERHGDAYEPIRARIRESKGRIRTQGATYLGYALLDAKVDAMFPLLEVYDERLERLEDLVFSDPSDEIAEDLHAMDRDLMRVRRAVLPMREALSRLVRFDHALLHDDVRVYLRDCQDHLTQMVDLLDGQRELAVALAGGHRSTLDRRSNEVMKVLTIIATIFIPLSFIAGVYGMNFETTSPYNMPELGWTYGYPALLGLMVAVGGGMLLFFRRKRWI